VGVCVPAHDEADVLAGCLDSVTAAAAECRRCFPGLRVVTVVAVDACTDGTATVAGSRGAVTVQLHRRCVGAARAAAADAVLARFADVAAADVWLACTDADSRVPPQWLTLHLTAAEAGADAVVGMVTVDDWEGRGAAMAAAWRRAHVPVRGHGHVHGANLGVRGDAYLAVGGFRALATGEDVDLVRRLSVARHVVRTPGAPVVTSARRAGRAPAGFAAHLDGLEGIG
jgi:glycosyltransferase involved in cell wall biosynthesis